MCLSHLFLGMSQVSFPSLLFLCPPAPTSASTSALGASAAACRARLAWGTSGEVLAVVFQAWKKRPRANVSSCEKPSLAPPDRGNCLFCASRDYAVHLLEKLLLLGQFIANSAFLLPHRRHARLWGLDVNVTYSVAHTGCQCHCGWALLRQGLYFVCCLVQWSSVVPALPS